mmetsp:Transcript_64272/g.172032  ORF Transcript_64272/g.172032 Transcript_64272/m.172032 type:complete len:108 (+) Transcript_64272:1-324(+)
MALGADDKMKWGAKSETWAHTINSSTERSVPRVEQKPKGPTEEQLLLKAAFSNAVRQRKSEARQWFNDAVEISNQASNASEQRKGMMSKLRGLLDKNSVQKSISTYF